jgi:hypothetical protein
MGFALVVLQNFNKMQKMFKLYIYIYDVIKNFLKNHQIGRSNYWLASKKIDPN